MPKCCSWCGEQARQPCVASQVENTQFASLACAFACHFASRLRCPVDHRNSTPSCGFQDGFSGCEIDGTVPKIKKLNAEVGQGARCSGSSVSSQTLMTLDNTTHLSLTSARHIERPTGTQVALLRLAVRLQDPLPGSRCPVNLGLDDRKDDPPPPTLTHPTIRTKTTTRIRRTDLTA